MLIKKIAVTLIIVIGVVGCASNSGGKVIRIDPKEMRDSDANYGVEDLHLFVQKMVSSMLQTPLILSSAKRKPYIGLGKISIGSGVDEHIDTKLIKNSIRTNLIKSTRVNFVDSEHIAKLKEEVDFQNSGYVDANTKIRRGKFIGKDYQLTGDIHAIKKNSNSTIDNFYALTLRLTDIKTSVIVWSEEKEIRKVQNR